MLSFTHISSGAVPVMRRLCWQWSLSLLYYHSICSSRLLRFGTSFSLDGQQPICGHAFVYSHFFLGCRFQHVRLLLVYQTRTRTLDMQVLGKRLRCCRTAKLVSGHATVWDAC